MLAPTSNQVSAVLRYATNSAASVGGVLVIMGFLSPDQSAALLADLHQITDGLQQAFGGFSKASALLGPIIVIWVAKMGYSASSLSSILKTVEKNGGTIKGVVELPAPIAAVVQKAVPTITVVPKGE
jgi:hypothetical protein